LHANRKGVPYGRVEFNRFHIHQVARTIHTNESRKTAPQLQCASNSDVAEANHRVRAAENNCRRHRTVNDKSLQPIQESWPPKQKNTAFCGRGFRNQKVQRLAKNSRRVLQTEQTKN
jgi:hypothetical protein